MPSLANLPPDVVIQIGAGVGFVHVGGLARSCRAYAGLTRDLAAREDLLRPTLRATAGPQWLHWLVEHAQALRSRGASEAALARVIQAGAGNVEGEAAVRLLGLAVQHGELGLFHGAGGADATLPHLQKRVRTAAVLAAPLPQPQQAATPHLAALEWHCQQQQLAAADLPYTVGAVASLAEPTVAEAEAQSLDIFTMLDDMCERVPGEVLQACDALLARLGFTSAYLVMKRVCERGQAELLRLLMDRDAFVAQLLGRCTSFLVLVLVCKEPQPELLLQQLLACEAFLARLNAQAACYALDEVCKQGQLQLLRLLLACDAFLARLPGWDIVLFERVCGDGQFELLQLLLACDAVLVRLDTCEVLCAVCSLDDQVAVAVALRQLLACDAFLARLDTRGAHFVLQYVRKLCCREVHQQLLACDAFLAQLGPESV